VRGLGVADNVCPIDKAGGISYLRRTLESRIIRISAKTATSWKMPNWYVRRDIIRTAIHFSTVTE